VEVISLEVAEIILDQELNVMRLCELLLIVIKRTTVGNAANVFESVISLDLLGTRIGEKTRVSVLAPVVGILLNLFEAKKTTKESPSYSRKDKDKDDRILLEEKKSNKKVYQEANAKGDSLEGSSAFHYDIMEALLSTEQFDMGTFDFIASFPWNTKAPHDPTMSHLGMKRLADFTAHLKKRHTEREEEKTAKKEQESTSPSTEEEECPICCAAMIDTRFVPCGHRSCKRCVQRHMLDNDSCFFCKVKIQNLELA